MINQRRGQVTRMACVLTVAATLTSACSTTGTLKLVPQSYALTEKIIRKLQLHLPDDTSLRNAMWGTGSGALIEIKMGDMLVMRAEELARALFADVVVTKSATAEAGRELVLTAKIILVEYSRPVFIFQDQRTTISLEWSLRDAEGSPVWLKTVTSQQKGRMGGVVSAQENAEKLVGRTIDDLFQQSFEQMSSALEIRGLVTR